MTDRSLSASGSTEGAFRTSLEWRITGCPAGRGKRTMTDVIEQTISDRDRFGEIWGSGRVLSKSEREPIQPPRAEEIWGPTLRPAAVFPLPSGPESIWGERAERVSNDRSPRSLQRPFALPAAWAASPRRPWWRERILRFVRVSRRTGWSPLARTGSPGRGVRPPAGAGDLRGS
jgi:hypothetical protein